MRDRRPLALSRAAQRAAAVVPFGEVGAFPRSGGSGRIVSGAVGALSLGTSPGEESEESRIQEELRGAGGARQEWWVGMTGNPTAARNQSVSASPAVHA